MTEPTPDPSELPPGSADESALPPEPPDGTVLASTHPLGSTWERADRWMASHGRHRWYCTGASWPHTWREAWKKGADASRPLRLCESGGTGGSGTEPVAGYVLYGRTGDPATTLHVWGLDPPADLDTAMGNLHTYRYASPDVDWHLYELREVATS